MVLVARQKISIDEHRKTNSLPPDKTIFFSVKNTLKVETRVKYKLN